MITHASFVWCPKMKQATAVKQARQGANEATFQKPFSMITSFNNVKGKDGPVQTGNFTELDGFG